GPNAARHNPMPRLLRRVVAARREPDPVPAVPAAVAAEGAGDRRRNMHPGTDGSDGSVIEEAAPRAGDPRRIKPATKAPNTVTSSLPSRRRTIKRRVEALLDPDGLQLVGQNGDVLLDLDANEAEFLRAVLARPGLRPSAFIDDGNGGELTDMGVLADLDVERRVLSAEAAVGNVPDTANARIHVALLDRVLAVARQHRGVGVALRDALTTPEPQEAA